VRLTAGVVGAAGVVAGAHLVPSVLTVPLLHRRLVPRLSGRTRLPHVALTFDDGPDPAATPAFLDALSRLQVRATFFVLGEQLARSPELGRRIVSDGHEVAVHGWRHRPHLLRTPWAVGQDVARTTEAIRSTCGVVPRFWRPPNGIVSGGGLYAAQRAGLRPVLWTADGQDWSAAATADSVFARLRRRLGAGGVVLLHDSDITSAPQSWRATLGAVAPLVEYCRERGWAVGPLGEHGLD
jgi:peptidoglycan/xylan/chitin deacetylase (PgdA/CDA1 family)